MKAPPAAAGEVIYFSRGAGLFALQGLIFLSAGGFIIVLAALMIPAVPGDSDSFFFEVLGLLMMAGAGPTFWISWRLAVRKPRLILTHDGMQWADGKRVDWEIPYEEVAEIGIFPGPWRRKVVGIRLLSNSGQPRRLPWRWRLWQRIWKQFGFDLVLPPQHSSEPSERVLETALTCLHRYRRMKESASEKPV